LLAAELAEDVASKLDYFQTNFLKIIINIHDSYSHISGISRVVIDRSNPRCSLLHRILLNFDQSAFHGNKDQKPTW